MKRMLLSAALAAAVSLSLSLGSSQAATFTYHGNLQDVGNAAEGNYDLELTLYSAAQGGSVIGGPLTMYAVPVQGGNFSTEADFGPLTKNIDRAWLAVKVRAAGKGEFAELSVRSQVVADSSVCPGAWTTSGNAGTVPGTGAGKNYLGTADGKALVIAVNGMQGGSIIPTADVNYTDSADIVFGSPGNLVNNNTGGATVSGGGSSTDMSCGPSGHLPCINSAINEFDTVGGGFYNTASGSFSSVSGGQSNSAVAPNATVGGGLGNTASGESAAVAGGDDNTASGQSSIVAGGSQNIAAGDDSFAAGNQVTISSSAHGTFVWADDTGSSLHATVADQFLVRATNGVAINGTPTSANDELTIYGNGNGSNNVDVDLFPHGATQGFSLVVTGGSGINPGFFIEQTDGSTTFTQVFSLDHLGNLAIAGTSATKAGSSQWTTTSDRRIKQDIAPIDGALDTVMRLRPVSFRYTPDYRAMAGGLADKTYHGFIAQEFAEVFPESVTRTDKHVPGAAADDATILALDPNPALITTVAAVQELAVRGQATSEEIDQLRQENSDLRRGLNEISARLGRLEAAQGK